MKSYYNHLSENFHQYNKTVDIISSAHDAFLE